MRAVLTLCLLLLGSPAPAAPDFQTFHTSFRAAVARNDAAAVAALTRLPFRFEGRLHGAEAFREQVWPRLFDTALRRCLAQAPAQVEGRDRVVFCPPYALYFDATDGGWKLREFGVDAEPD